MALLTSQRIAEFLGKERIPWESLSGILHITLLYDDASHAHLQNIKTQSPSAPRNLFDFLLLNTTRARSSIVITSGATLRCEGGNEIKLCKPFDKDLQSWRREDLGICNGGKSFVMTKSGDLSPSWPIFSTPDSIFSPVFFANEKAVLGIQDRFKDSKVPILSFSKLDQCISDEEFDSFLNALKRILAAEGQPTTWLPHRSKAIPHVISIECGPSMTGPLYETIDGGLRQDCPVDWLLLTRFSGHISSDALGENVIQKTTINHLFDLVVSSPPSYNLSDYKGGGGASGIGVGPSPNCWTCGLWKRR